MPTIGDKLTAIYDIKNKIRDAIVNKGGALHEKSALSDYPQAIYDLPVVSAPEDTYNYHPNPAWWDIKTIIENDEVPEGYVAVAAFLLIDSPYKTTLDVYDAYKTSDGMFYNSAAEHIWDTTKDKDSGEGYKTRYVIAYVKKDSNRWLGKMLCARSIKQGVDYALPIGCLGVVWNCPVFVALRRASEYTITSNLLDYASRIRLYKGKNSSEYISYYALSICWHSWNTLQYIDSTKKGKLIIGHIISAFGYGSFKIPISLHSISPLYEVAVVYKELIAESIANATYKYVACAIGYDDYFYLTRSTGDVSESVKDMNGTNWGHSLRKMEIHVADKEIYANTIKRQNNFPAGSNFGGLYTCAHYSAQNNYYCTTYPLNGKKLTMVIEPNTLPLDTLAFYPKSTWTELTVVEYIPRLFILNTLDNLKNNTENDCTLGIIDWTIINKSDTKPQVHLFPAYQLNGMPASKLNKFIVDYLQDRTGMSVYQMYITASQNEKLSSTTKQIIAKRNWTLVVFS